MGLQSWMSIRLSHRCVDIYSHNCTYSCYLDEECRYAFCRVVDNGTFAELVAVCSSTKCSYCRTLLTRYKWKSVSCNKKSHILNTLYSLKLKSKLRDSITGDYAIIVEDILDSGLTLSYLLKLMQDKRPESIEVCTLLRKPSQAKVDIDVEYLGVDIDPEFVIGYGLDYNEHFRGLDCIGVPTQETIEKYASK